MTVLTLNLKNASAVGKKFFIFADKPKTSTSADKVFLNVFLVLYVPASNSASFRWNRDCYACVGQQKLQNGATVSQVGSLGPVTLGTPNMPGSSYRLKIDGGSPSISAESPNSAKDGAYNFYTGIDFDQGSDNWIGMGNKDEKTGSVTPVATIQAVPNSVTNIYPHLDYYCATGDNEQGEIIDWQNVGTTCKVSFTSVKDTISVQYNPNGTWTS